MGRRLGAVGLLLKAQAWLAGRFRTFERLEDVFGGLLQSGAVSDQHIAARGVGVEGMAGNSEDIAAWIKGYSCGDEAAGICGGFDDDNGLGKA